MKLFKQLFYVFIFVATFISCDDYLDINTDPNNPNSAIVGTELILPAVQNGSYAAIAGNTVILGNRLMNQWAGDVTNYTGGNSNEYRFNVTSTFYSGIWDQFYLVTDKIQTIINKNSEETVYYTAIAKILKSHNMQIITDLYGNAPYSEAFQRGANYQPAYDDAKSIYMGIYSELEEAIVLIDGATNKAVLPGSTDIMLGGDMSMWKKFANTLKLKVLIRASSSSDGDIQAFVNTKFPTLNGQVFLGPGENIMVNPGYAADAGKQNPFWNNYGLTPGGDQTTGNKFNVGSEYFIEYLKGSGTVAPLAPTDPRISVFFTTASGSGGNYQGIEQGADDPDNPNIGLSFIGSGLLDDAKQDGYFFSASESLFLQAEATMNGKITGNAQTLFESGITESFSMYGLNASVYITAITGVNGVGWGVNNLESIMRQKWIALHSINPAESLIEHNRTGFPNPPLPLLTSQTHRPYRLAYPATEITGNTANVPNLTSSDIFSPTLFWQN